MRDAAFDVFMIVFGAIFAIHCPRAALREFRSGVAKGLNPVTQVQKDFVRAAQPVSFWLTIVGTFLAGIMGLMFFVFGIAALVAVES